MAELSVICTNARILPRILSRVVQFFLILLLSFVSLAPVSADGEAYLIDIEGPIGPAVADHVTRGLDEANAVGAPLVIIRIDTPGGLVTSTRDIIKSILAQDRPIVGFVAPSGARAASAGAYILLACHVAVMAPGTNVGSATPVMMGGAPAGDAPKTEKSEHPDLTDKIINDAKAYMRTISQMRGRPGDVAEQFVSQASNVTAAEALEMGLIDLGASNVRDMLNKLEGRTVSIGEQDVKLVTGMLDVKTFERTWRDELLAFITNPNIAYLLLMAGIYGLIIEFSNPGFIVPGVVGGVCLILGLYALQLLPINYAGVALILLGLALMVTEAFVPAFGALGLGGIIAFIIGSIMLIDSDLPELQISPVLIGTVSLATAAIFVFVLTFAVKAWRRPAVSGNAAILGGTARVVKWQQGGGTVLAHGEVWSAEGDLDAAEGDIVKVTKIDGLKLTIARREEGKNTSLEKEHDD